MDFNDFHFCDVFESLRSRKVDVVLALRFSACAVLTPIIPAATLKILRSASIYQPRFCFDIFVFVLAYETAVKLSIILEYAVSLRPRSIFVMFR